MREKSAKGFHLPPFTKAAIDGLVRSIAFGIICPGSAISSQPEYSVEHHPVIFGRPTNLCPGDQILDLFPLHITEFIPLRCHNDTPAFLLLYRFLHFVQLPYCKIVFQIRPNIAMKDEIELGERERS